MVVWTLALSLGSSNTVSNINLQCLVKLPQLFIFVIFCPLVEQKCLLTFTSWSYRSPLNIHGIPYTTIHCLEIENFNFYEYINLKATTYNSFIFHLVWKLVLGNICVGNEHFADSLRKPFHIPLPDLRVRTLKFGDDVKTLRQLREHINHWVGEQRVFRALLKLKYKKEY